MKSDNFLNLLQDKTQVQQIENVELKSILDEFPYFQSARALYLKKLKNQDSFKYNKELKITAAYTQDRTVLFEYITSNKFLAKQEDIHQQITSKISEIKVPEKEFKKELQIIEPTKKVEEKLGIGKPITFSNSENFSFNQWLQLSSKKPITRDPFNNIKTLKKDEIIENFIQNNPKIEPVSKEKSISISVTKNKQDTSLMTETLAKVYLEQKKYENAIQAYKILILKYPEKSGFFADQIKRIQILQKHK